MYRGENIVDMVQLSRRRAIHAGVVTLVGSVAGCSSVNNTSTPTQQASSDSRKVSVTHPEGNKIRWILPGKRRLDEKIFGTPDNPKGTEESVGVPLSNRLTNDAGTEFTTTKNPTPFSDKSRTIDGSFEYSITDATPIDMKGSEDATDAKFTFTDPPGNNDYTVTLKKTLPVGPEHPIMGGTAVNLLMHGTTGIGTRLQPTQLAYGTFWGAARFKRNGETVHDSRLLHVMTTERVRTLDGKLLTDSELPHEGSQTHLMMPPVEVTSDGPNPNPVASSYKLPNGQTQPFLHVVFHKSDVTGVGTLG